MNQFERHVAAMMDHLRLDCLINYTLEVTRVQEASQRFHELGLVLRSKKHYTLLGGQQVDFIALNGVIIPDRLSAIARLHFTPHVEPVDQCALVRRDDEDWGEIYAHLTEVQAAFDGILAVARQYEGRCMEITAVCPEAKTEMRPLLTVSLRGFYTYFRRFRHLSEAGRLDHYCTDEKHLASLSFVPGARPPTKGR
jgi:hypothetical protein